MYAALKAFGLGLAVLSAACSSAPDTDLKETSAVTVGGAASTAPSSQAVSDAGAADVPPLTEEELRRLLDALEQEIAAH